MHLESHGAELVLVPKMRLYDCAVALRYPHWYIRHLIAGNWTMTESFSHNFTHLQADNSSLRAFWPLLALKCWRRRCFNLFLQPFRLSFSSTRSKRLFTIKLFLSETQKNILPQKKIPPSFAVVFKTSEMATSVHHPGLPLLAVFRDPIIVGPLFAASPRAARWPSPCPWVLSHHMLVDPVRDNPEDLRVGNRWRAEVTRSRWTP